MCVHAKNISLTATEEPITEIYLTLRRTCHGNKTDIPNEYMEEGQANF
jgi:hypothetical protein